MTNEVKGIESDSQVSEDKNIQRKNKRTTKKKKIAIVGSGISGISLAYYLADEYDVTIFEKEDYLGGHTHTHEFDSFTLDTGFIVFNDRTYPNLLSFFKELGVQKQKSSMSISIKNVNSGIEFSIGTNVLYVFPKYLKSHIFNQGICSITHWKFIFELYRFFRVVEKMLKENKGVREELKISVQEFCDENAFSNYFKTNFLIPLLASIWSVPTNSKKLLQDFPLSLLLPFFKNHGLLGYRNQPQWYVVRGGSNQYIKEVMKRKSIHLRLNESAVNIEEVKNATTVQSKSSKNAKHNTVKVTTSKGKYIFDYAVLSCHSDQALQLYSSSNSKYSKVKSLLSKFIYSKNRAVLHTDSSIMPKHRRFWSSWNQLQYKDAFSTTYWLNELQNPNTTTNYFLTLNSCKKIKKETILKEIEYTHPYFTTENFSIQKRLKELNEDTSIFFCGAYFRYGFHEDGISSALDVVKILKEKKGLKND